MIIQIINEDDEATSSKDFDFNRYATKKTFSNGFLNGALLATNGAQLKLLLTESLYAKGFYLEKKQMFTKTCDDFRK